jgi:Spy/CpxP family protein refolding chaperone
MTRQNWMNESARAESAMMGGQGMEPGMMGPCMMGVQAMMQPGPSLSDEQRARIDEIRTDACKKQLDLARQLRSARRKLEALYDMDKPDHAATRSEREKIQDLRLQVMQDSMTAQNEIDDVLTDKQWEQLHHWQRAWTN